jgi:hypothetical protein
LSVFECEVYRPTKANVKYAEKPPWEIPISVESERVGSVKITTAVDSGVLEMDGSEIEERVSDIAQYYSSNGLTGGLVPFVRKKIYLTVLAKDSLLTPLVLDEEELPQRGMTRTFFPEGLVELSWPACQETCRKLEGKYRERHLDLAAMREWTPKGWMIHALAHELAHLVVWMGDVTPENKPLTDIVAEIFAARYGWDKMKKVGDKITIPVPAGRYLKRRWSELGINSDDSATCSRFLEETLAPLES